MKHWQPDQQDQDGDPITGLRYGLMISAVLWFGIFAIWMEILARWPL